MESVHYITFSNGIIYKFLPEIVSSYNLRDGMTIDEGQLNTIITENKNQLCYNEILEILNRRPHTIFEVREKLFNKGFKSLEINNAIEKAYGLNLLDDKNTAEIYMSELSNKGYGRLKIIQAMKQKGISPDMARELTSEMCRNEQEEEKAHDVFYKKLNFLKKNKSLTEQKIKERLFRFMQSKGFSNDIIFALLKKISSENEEFYNGKDR